MGTNSKPFPRKLFSDFSKRELQDFLETLHYAVEAQTEEDVSDTLGLIRKVIPCQHLIAGLVSIDPVTGNHKFVKLLNVSYPEKWVQLYLSNNYANVDPVLLSHVKSFRTQTWTNCYNTAVSWKGKAFVEEAKSFGLGDGITTGTFDSNRSVGSFFSFAGGMTKDNQRYARVLEFFGHHFHRALINAVPSPSYAGTAHLSPRELSVLTWVKNGKTNWEISRILGVSERTVRFHVSSIFSKLDVTSRTQAVVLAVENGLLTAL